ncbi:MAG TPA: M3 family metallopeptidase, partial [Novosphingobium sp.]|nr:M3 family metallopeptidase [Novosphingobium sp.]
MIRRLLLCASALLPLPLLPLPALAATGPFASPSTLPFEAPDFTRLHDADYQPAIEQAIALQRAEIEAIAANPAPPSFANTIEAMERSGAMLTRATNVFSALVAANTNDTLDKADTATAPQLAALHDAIMMNAQLFARVNHLYEQRAHLGLAPDQLQLLEVTWRGFRLSGALLAPEAKLQLQAINQQLSTLQTSFSQKLVAATKDAAPTFADKAQLAGLAEGDLAAAAKAAEERKAPAGSYVLPLQNTLQQPALESLTNRATRQALYTASATRAEQGNANDTRATILEIARLRAQKAQLLGYPDYASLALADQMAQTPARAIAFMQALVPPLAAQAHAEAADLDALIAKEGGHFTVEPWDWPLYAAQLRKSRLAFDAASAKPYFEITRVLEQGVFYAAHQLYGLSFEKRGDIPTYHRDVSVYTVKNAQGQAIGLFYFDPWKRDNKQGGAWMSNFVQQSTLLGEQPVVFNVENFTPPAPGQPALVGFDDVVTMFHEFGHALHGLLSDQRYPSLAGTSTARDFVEFPSQFNENWAT